MSLEKFLKEKFGDDQDGLQKALELYSAESDENVNSLAKQLEKAQGQLKTSKTARKSDQDRLSDIDAMFKKHGIADHSELGGMLEKNKLQSPTVQKPITAEGFLESDAGKEVRNTLKGLVEKVDSLETTNKNYKTKNDNSIITESLTNMYNGKHTGIQDKIELHIARGDLVVQDDKPFWKSKDDDGNPFVTDFETGAASRLKSLENSDTYIDPTKGGAGTTTSGTKIVPQAEGSWLEKYKAEARQRRDSGENSRQGPIIQAGVNDIPQQ